MWKRLINYFRQSDTDIGYEEALNVIEAHGYKAHKYFATIGSHHNSDLFKALDKLESLGYIVTDRKGKLVGKVATARLDSNSIALQRRATFRVVD